MGLKVVVTGASSGIGRAVVLKFAEDGHEVFATARSEAKLSETVQLAKGDKVHKGIGDVGVEADVKRNYAEAVEALGEQIDVVVLNAGVAFSSPLEDYSAEDFDNIFNANVRGVFLWLKSVLPAFKKRGSGQIIIINSVSGEAALMPNMSLYTASKFAISGLSESLRLELQGSGVKVGSVLPGVVDTNLFSTPSWEKSGAEGRALFRVDKAALSPDDVAGAVATIAYQSSRSDIEKIKVRPHKPLAAKTV